MQHTDEQLRLEFEYWKDTATAIDWTMYGRVFGPYLTTRFSSVIEVSSSPMPYVCSTSINTMWRATCNPLFRQYMTLPRYENWWKEEIMMRWYNETAEVSSDSYDAVFCLDYLNAVCNPAHLATELIRMLDVNGLLFVCVDVNGACSPLRPNPVTRQQVFSMFKNRLKRILLSQVSNLDGLMWLVGIK